MGQLSNLAKLPVVRKAAAALVLSAAGVLGIVNHEASVPVVYQDVVGINTVCVGHVTTLPVGTYVSQDTCTALLQADTKIAQDAIRATVKTPVSQGQYDALVSFVFNVGTGAFKSSTLLRKLNAGDCRGAAAEFQKWDMAGGKHVKGLLNRRLDEAVQFIKDCP
jgi:lysozyme